MAPKALRGETAFAVRVSGRVQRLGYRRFLLDLAQERKLAGYVANNRDGSVTIFVQGEEELVQDFLKLAQRPPSPVEVVSFDVKPRGARPKMPYFTIKFGSVTEELQEGFGAMHSEFHDYRNEFRSYGEEFRDYRKEFRDFRGEFRAYRGDFNDFAARTDANFKSLETRYGEISEKLTQILGALETESVATRNELKRAVDNLARLIDQFISRSTGSP